MPSKSRWRLIGLKPFRHVRVQRIVDHLYDEFAPPLRARVQWPLPIRQAAKLLSYVERSNLSMRMASRRFTRLTNGFSKKLEHHAAAVSLYVAHYNLCRVHESLRSTPAMALGITERVWTIGDLLDAALATQPIDPVVTAPDRRRLFRVIEGGR